MIKKEYIPRFLLYTGSVLIFISLFARWETLVNVGTGETIITYGYQRLDAILVLFISSIPIISYEYKGENNISHLFIPFFEFVILVIFQPAHLLIYAVEVGYGYYLALLGILYQLIGIIAAIMIERIKKETDAPPTDRSEQVGENR
jgi:hypothetical protein